MANKIDFGANTQVERSNSSEAFFSKYQKQILIAVVAVVLVIAGLLQDVLKGTRSGARFGFFFEDLCEFKSVAIGNIDSSQLTHIGSPIF